MGEPGMSRLYDFAYQLLTTGYSGQTPLTVSPQLPLEIVMQLFKRMG